MAWDQGYQQDWGYDPYGGQQGYDAYGGEWGGYDPYSGYDPWAAYEQPQEDTESAKLRKEEEVKKRREALESNRLYLKKIKKKCVMEDFGDLEGVQLFLFEVLVESLEVHSEGSLGVVPDAADSYVTVRAQFLNSPYLEICEKDMVAEGNSFDESQVGTEYMQSVNDAGLWDALPAERYVPENAEGFAEEGEEKEEEKVLTTKWVNASGKSCLFSRTALQMVQDLDRHPVVLQVVRVAVPPTPASDEDGDAVEVRSEPCARQEVLGYVRLRLPDQFGLSVLQSCKSGVVLPVGCVHRQTCTVHSPFGANKGQLDLFVRLSCFGPAIVTSFRTEGADRRYVFKPSPIVDLPAEGEKEPDRGELLKPIIAEDQATVGISVMRPPDMFQTPVVWKATKKAFNCGFPKGDDLSYSGSAWSVTGSVTGSTLSTLARLPEASDVSLCKEGVPLANTKCLRGPKRFGKTEMCDWHNLVSLEVKNSPGGNCGCLRVPQTGRDSAPGKLDMKTPQICEEPKTSSRLAKMKLAGPGERPDYGGKPEGVDCECDCPLIKENLRNNKLFLI